MLDSGRFRRNTPRSCELLPLAARNGHAIPDREEDLKMKKLSLAAGAAVALTSLASSGGFHTDGGGAGGRHSNHQRYGD